MTMLQHGLVPSTGGYRIERSLRFNSADSAYLNRTPGSAGNRRTFTWSGWVKRSVTGVETNVFVAGPYVSSAFKNFRIRFTSGEALEVYNYDSSYQIQLISSAVYRDPSAWYHIVVAVDTTQATNTNRVKVYVNGIQVTAFGTATYPNQNLDTEINTTEAHYLGFKYSGDGNGWFSGYLTEVHFIDGSAKTPSDFGETDTDTGVWKPKAYSGSYGTNGFYLKFADNSGTTSTTLGKDSSGNGNNWTPNNFSVTAGAGNDSLVDTPTPYGTDTGAGGEVRGNYATINPLNTVTANVTLSNGNLDYTENTLKGLSIATFGLSSGKWYWEHKIGATNYCVIGMYQSGSLTMDYLGFSGVSLAFTNGGSTVQSGVSAPTGSISSFTSSDTIGFAYNADTGTLTVYRNNVSALVYTGLTGTWFPAQGANDNASGSFNFGQRPFAYTAPSGFKALCTQNLPTPTIGATATTRADDYFNTVLYTGDGANPRTITGVGFQPDLVWVKRRDGVSNNFLQDAVRGVTSTDSRSLVSNATDAETNYYTVNGGVTAFTSDGFTTSGGTTNNNLNNSGNTMVAWNWKANGAGSSNTSGTITSTVSANTTAGFSIVTATAQSSGVGTFGHGLGVAPSMVIIKGRGSASSWGVYHISTGSGGYLLLNSTSAYTTDLNFMNNTSPSSTVFTLGASYAGYGTFVTYCFAPVAGYSAFGSYTGNGSTDGVFVYTGFRPAFVIVKCSTAIRSWNTLDTKRSSYNVVDKVIYTGQSDAELTVSNVLDFTSNGFKIRTDWGGVNTSNETYIYACFAEVPTKFSLAR